jgi:hypothetical protein
MEDSVQGRNLKVVPRSGVGNRDEIIPGGLKRL